MRDRADDRFRGGTRLDRRACLAAFAAGWLSPALLPGFRGRAFGFQDSADPVAGRDEPDPSGEEAIRARAEQAGLGPLRTSTTEHYLGIGDAPDSFLGAALKLCEELAQDYFRHFRARGFEAAEPARSLAVVVLKDAGSFAAFLGEDLGPGVAGIYDLDANRLVMFDNRALGRNDFAAQRANTIALIHEATHQLTFNTGLLDRLGDVPLLISEGLATYGEVRRPDDRAKIGQVNRERLGVIAESLRGGESLLPIGQLFTDDSLFERPDTRQKAYAQAWLLVHAHLGGQSSSGRFRDYLSKIRGRRDASSRLEDARDHFGDLDVLDKSLRAYGVHLARV